MMPLDVDALMTILLLFMRVFPFILMVPLFGTFPIPGFVRVYLAFAISLSLFSIASIKPAPVSSTATFINLALHELLFGFVSGLFLRLLFDAVFMAGEIIAVNTGLGFLTMFLPQQPQTTVLAGFSTLLASTLFLSIGGAEAVYLGLKESIRSVPIGSFDLYALNGEVFLRLFYGSFSLGVKVALPVLIASLLTNIILAVVNRFIPQINVFMVGLPLQVLIGIVVFMLSLPVIGLVLTSHIREYIRNFLQFLGYI